MKCIECDHFRQAEFKNLLPSYLCTSPYQARMEINPFDNACLVFKKEKANPGTENKKE